MPKTVKSGEAGPRLSPGRKQYLRLKKDYPDSLLLFRMGDFYETFDADAETMARVLDITLTARDVGGGARSPLAGIPHHALESYLGRLIKAGLKVAIAEQTSDPATSKGVVDRAVVRVVTPGTVIDPGMLDQDKSNYLASVCVFGDRAGLAYVDLSTSEFVTSEFDLRYLRDELQRIDPAEVLGTKSAIELLHSGAGAPIWVARIIDESRLDAEIAEETLKRHFRVSTLDAFGCLGRPLAITAAGAALDFLADTQMGAVPQITALRTIEHGRHMVLDHRALRDLEVFEPSGGRQGAPTLLSVLDRTGTAMGSRLLRAWLGRPLLDLEALNHRLESVEWLVQNAPARGAVRDVLSRIPDLERLMNRVRTFTANPRDMASLARGLARVPALLDALGGDDSGKRPLELTAGAPRACEELVVLVQKALVDDPPVTVGDGNAIARGFDAELDEVSSLSTDARSRIAAIESDARDRTGIKSLKVGYNKVFGYFIEVSKANTHLVPAEFERRQTLVNGERFITPSLKELESRILSARDRIGELERSLFRRLCGDIAEHAERVMATARSIAELDALASLAQTAAENGWVRPKVDDGDSTVVVEARHPVVEAAVGSGRFVPNDINLSTSDQQLLIITGPNMSGKSTFIRMTAVLCLMAQVGSYVPASEARFGLVDRIFTRAGLSDDITGGQSTFMVEMIETASILNQATRRSLAVLDEIGRGTSTYDGLAIARAVAEHIHNSPKLGCRTLFATHYHEMTAVADSLPRAANYRVAVAEEGNEVVFLHRIVPGGADRSYGVHVARLAGMPAPVVRRAWHLLEELESTGPKASALNPAVQLDLFSASFPVLNDELLGLDLDNMTPLDALNALYRLRQKVDGDSKE